MYKIALVAASLISVALATGYEEHGYGHGGGHNDKYESHYPPQPYKFGYDIKDGYGGTLNQKEEGDSYGNKKGTYGYTDSYGIYRQVEYVADKHGFRATVKTNEPGTANQNPADVYIHSSAGPTHYESAPYKSASHAAPHYAPAKVAQIYKVPSYGKISQAYSMPIYADAY